jgi:hypothetical protein
LRGLQQLTTEIPQNEFKGLSRAQQGVRAHLTLESILYIDPRSPAKTSGGMILAPEMLVNVEGVIVGFGEPGRLGQALKGGRSIDVALLKESILSLNDLIGRKASNAVLAGIDYKTGSAKLSRVKHMESLIKAPYVRLSRDGDVVKALETKLARLAPVSPVETVEAAKPAAAPAGRLARMFASAGEALPAAARLAGQVFTVAGAAKEAQRTVDFERQHGRGELNAALAGATTFVAGMFAGVVDDVFAAAQMSVMGAPAITLDAWEQQGAGPIQHATGEAVRGFLGWGFRHGF